ncbi:hypothetical protein PGTUg99_017400 [Puccinia graminis f. sp. tritici]|uniref:Uncharacterized protein n=1 Tax=Puccinia graminis f. sp. tritici TaxID=56615 RepID=A0A5B0M529_PUCGR|nr:hypothetical protein PGTUg99_017400 [Puccinia graminis f. sp. tritici]
MVWSNLCLLSLKSNKDELQKVIFQARKRERKRAAKERGERAKEREERAAQVLLDKQEKS